MAKEEVMDKKELKQFLKRQSGDGIILCLKHRTRDNDVWYDCQKCCEESIIWARENGFDQCISPYLSPRDGSDNGAWVKANKARWVTPKR